MQTRQIFITGAAALLFAVVFLAGGGVHPLRPLLSARSGLSFGAGISIAYVFVHVMPELHSVRSAFVASASVPLRYEGMAIYFVALVGFLAFYGLDHLRALTQSAAVKGDAGADFKIQIGGFAAYVGLMAYLLVNNIEDTLVSTLAYAAAISFHFLALDHSLRAEHGAAYVAIGRFILAGASLLGWGLGFILRLPISVIALLVAFISGAIVINSSIMELPSEKDGKFLAFAAGSIVYGLILMPLG